MRVTLLTTNLARGGAENQVAQLALGLHGREWDASVISLLEPSAWQAELRAAGIPVFAPGISGVPVTMRQLRPQILHCHMFHANVLGRVLRLVAPVPVVISTIHSLAETGRTSNEIRWRDRVYRVTNPLVDVTVAVSKAAAERHEKLGAATRIRVIPNGIDTRVFAPDTAARQHVRAELGLADEFAWLAVGRLMWKKDYSTLLDAFARLNTGELLIAGAGPEERTLRSAAGPRIRFLGARDDIPALMNAADGFVLSSVVEGLPVVLLEAGASALPCVVTDVGGVSETGVPIAVVPPRDATALSAAMADVMSWPEDERRRLGERTRKHVRDCFELERVIDQWEALYRELWT